MSRRWRKEEVPTPTPVPRCALSSKQARSPTGSPSMGDTSMMATVTQPVRPEAAEGGGPDPHTRSQVRSVFETGPVPDRFSFHVASTRFFSRCGAQESNLSGPACRAGALPESEPREAEISGEQGLAVGSLSRQIYSLLITHELAAHPVERRGFAPRSLPREGRVLLLDDRPEMAEDTRREMGDWRRQGDSNAIPEGTHRLAAGLGTIANSCLHDRCGGRRRSRAPHPRGGARCFQDRPGPRPVLLPGAVSTRRFVAKGDARSAAAERAQGAKRPSTLPDARV